MLAAQRGQTGQSGAAGHVQIKQYQIDVRHRRHYAQRRSQIGGFVHAAWRHAVHRGLTQGGAKQRVVVGDQQ